MLVHPKKLQQRAQFYPHSVTIKDVSYANVSGLVDLACNYEAAPVADLETFEAEAPATDKILMQGYYTAIKAGLRAFVTLNTVEGAVTKKFHINDVQPVNGANQLLLLVTPKA